MSVVISTRIRARRNHGMHPPVLVLLSHNIKTLSCTLGNGPSYKDLVDAAMNIDDNYDYQDQGAALIMAVDVARFGDDETVLGFRQGNDHRSFPLRKFKGLDNVAIAQHAAQLANEIKPDVTVIEATGPGSGVIDILRWRGYRVEEVYPGAQAQQSRLYVNRRAKLWAKLRDWLMAGGRLPQSSQLAKQLISIKYRYDRGEQRIIMESKAAMKKRGLPSPDWADMLSLTFAPVVPRRDLRSSAWLQRVRGVRAHLDEHPLDDWDRRGSTAHTEPLWER